ncbi:MAG: TolC family protein [Flavobacteriales bacterium]|nr:TolC family protein [Flavobacteriales bacterium]
MITMRRASTALRIIMVSLLVTLLAAQGSAQIMTLEQCVDSALANDRRVRMAALDEEMSTLRIGEAKAGLIPKVRGAAEFRHYTDLPYQLMPSSFFGGPEGAYRAVQFGTTQNINANLQAQMPLYDPQVWGGIQMAREGDRIVGLQGERTREAVVLEVSNVYYNLQIMNARLAFLDSNVVNAEDLVRNTELLHDQALARASDVDRLRLQHAQLLTQRERARSQYAQAMDALRMLIGVPVDAPLEVTAPEAVLYTTAPTARLGTGVRTAEQAMRLKTAELQLVKRSRIPSLNATGLYGTTGFGPIGAEDRYDYYPIGYFGVQLQVPIFQGTVLGKRIKGKELELEHATLQRDVALERDALEHRAALRDEALARRTLADSEAQLELADRIRRSTLLQHGQGVASLSDIVLADQAFWDAQQNYINALVDLRKAQLELARINGTLLPTQRP